MEQLMTTAEAAEKTGLSEAWFEKARWLGAEFGPPYIKLGRAVRYRPSEIDRWLTDRSIGVSPQKCS